MFPNMPILALLPFDVGEVEVVLIPKTLMGMVPLLPTMSVAMKTNT